MKKGERMLFLTEQGGQKMVMDNEEQLEGPEWKKLKTSKGKKIKK